MEEIIPRYLNEFVNIHNIPDKTVPAHIKQWSKILYLGYFYSDFFFFFNPVWSYFYLLQVCFRSEYFIQMMKYRYRQVVNTFLWYQNLSANYIDGFPFWENRPIPLRLSMVGSNVFPLVTRCVGYLYCIIFLARKSWCDLWMYILCGYPN